MKINKKPSVKTINKINASWEPLGSMPEISDSGTFSMRGMQSKALFLAS